VPSLHVALIAGELSGDLLGAALMEALRARFPGVRFSGVAGPRMKAAGCEVIESIDSLSVMGIAEVLPALPRLLRLRASLVERYVRERPDVVIGIDAPDFNLGLETRLRRHGLRTVHLVSPTVWAWRAGRVETVRRAVEQVLCLFPFEPAFYAARGVSARYVGHPLADRLDNSVSSDSARANLGMSGSSLVLTVLPGSRNSEIRHLMPLFAQAARLLALQIPSLHLVLPIARHSLRAPIEAAIAAHAPDLSWTLLDGQSHEAVRAGDAVLVASGTATLECLLLGRPMTVAYKGSALTAWLLLKAGVLKTPYVSLPNLLCAEPVVTELLQDKATPEALAADVLPLLTRPEARLRQTRAFDAVRQQLRKDAASCAAGEIAALLQRPSITQET